MQDAKRFAAGDQSALADMLEALRLDRKNLSGRFRDAILTAPHDTLGWSGMGYVLSRIEQHLALVEAGQEGTVTGRPYTEHVTKANDIEHILAQSPEAHAAQQEFGPGWETLAQHIGNLTLLDASSNRSLQDKPYSSKVVVYGNSTLRLTASLHHDLGTGVGTTTHKARMARQLKAYARWDARAVLDRAVVLYNLAAQVWGVELVQGPLPTLEEGVVSSNGHSAKRTLPQLAPENLLPALEALGAGYNTEADLATRVGRERGDYLAGLLGFTGLAEEVDENVWELTEDGLAILALPSSERIKAAALAVDRVGLIVTWRQSDQETQRRIVESAGYTGTTIGRKSQEIDRWSRWPATILA